MSVVAFDTSNYTTSVAFFDGKEGSNCSRLLPVKQGELGLRQSDAVFQHIKCLPELSDRLFSHIDISQVTAVGVSTRPRNVNGSYMPCFMVGVSHGKLLADALHVPLITCSHQEGHIAAACWSAGREDLLDQPHLAWHLSGGTTELLLVQPEDGVLKCEKIGGTTDISAGQLIDRTGQMLDLPFPSGKYLDELASEAHDTSFFKVRADGTFFSLSGVENKVRSFRNGNPSPCETAAYAQRSVIFAVKQATENARKQYPGLPVLFSGGVSSNSGLRTAMSDCLFAPAQYSTDNALGVAVITYRNQVRGNAE